MTPRLLDYYRNNLLWRALDTLIETASTAFLDTLDDSAKLTAQLYLEDAAQAGDEVWRQLVQGHNGSTVTETTSVEEDDSAHRKFKPHYPCCLTEHDACKAPCRPKERGNKWRIESLCCTHVSHKWLNYLVTCALSVLTTHDDEETRQHGLRGLWSVPLMHAFTPSLRMLADPGLTMEPRGHSETQSSVADIFTTAAFPGRSAGLDVCGCSGSPK